MGAVRTNYVFVFLIILFSLNSCWNSSSDTTSETVGSSGGEIISKDGKLRLVIPPGALDEDTDISVRRLDFDEILIPFPELEDNEDVLDSGYELSPDGLEFNIPALLLITLDDTPTQEDGSLFTDLPFIFNSSGNSVELLDDLSFKIDINSDEITASGLIDHFSEPVAVKSTGSGYKVELNIVQIADLNDPFSGDLSINFTFSADSVDNTVITENDTGASFSIGDISFVDTNDPNSTTLSNNIDAMCLSRDNLGVYTLSTTFNGVENLSAAIFGIFTNNGLAISNINIDAEIDNILTCTSNVVEEEEPLPGLDEPLDFDDPNDFPEDDNISKLPGDYDNTLVVKSDPTSISANFFLRTLVRLLLPIDTTQDLRTSNIEVIDLLTICPSLTGTVSDLPNGSVQIIADGISNDGNNINCSVDLNCSFNNEDVTCEGESTSFFPGFESLPTLVDVTLEKILE